MYLSTVTEYLYFVTCHLWWRLRDSHLKCVFAGSVSGLQRSPGEADYAADGDDAASAPLHHVRQHPLGDGHCAQEVKVHQGLKHIQVGLCAQRALRAATVVNQNVDLRKDRTGQWENGSSCWWWTKMGLKKIK